MAQSKGTPVGSAKPESAHRRVQGGTHDIPIPGILRLVPLLVQPRKFVFQAPVAFYRDENLPAVCLASGARDGVEMLDFAYTRPIPANERKIFSKEGNPEQTVHYSLPFQPAAFRTIRRKAILGALFLAPAFLALVVGFAIMTEGGRTWEDSTFHWWCFASVPLFIGCAIPFFIGSVAIEPNLETVTLKFAAKQESVYRELERSLERWTRRPRPKDSAVDAENTGDEDWANQGAATWDEGQKPRK